MGKWRTQLKLLRQYRSLAAGLALITVFVVVALYAVIAMPYSEAIRLWRGGPGVWDDSPRNARPVWFDLFTRDRLSRTMRVSNQDQLTRVEPLDDNINLVTLVVPFKYSYDGFPTELILSMESSLATDISLSWRTPDGRTIMLLEDRLIGVGTSRLYISQDMEIFRRLGDRLPHLALFADPDNADRVLKGDYQMVVIAELPEGAELKAKLVVYGEIHGLAGTDHLRRDLMVALLWGAPIALVFGLLAAIGAQVSTFVLAGIGTWLGGKVDATFRWLTQVNSVLPGLAILIMVGHLYSRSIWVMLGLVIALNVFSASLFTYRAMYLQAKEAPYFEAAQAYGAGDFRIIFRYLLPRLSPTLLPQFVLVVPTFVFLEATLAVIGLGDPILPTWGKVIQDAYGQGALYKGQYYWIIQPSVLLMVMGVGFALIGFSLDRIFNPRLRTV